METTQTAASKTTTATSIHRLKSYTSKQMNQASTSATSSASHQKETGTASTSASISASTQISQLQNPSATSKKKDPTSHRIIEKRRRDRMNNCLNALSKLIPTRYFKKGSGRFEKTEIVETAIKYMKDLMSEYCALLEIAAIKREQILARLEERVQSRQTSSNNPNSGSDLLYYEHIHNVIEIPSPLRHFFSAAIASNIISKTHQSDGSIDKDATNPASSTTSSSVNNNNNYFRVKKNSKNAHGNENSNGIGSNKLIKQRYSIGQPHQQQVNCNGISAPNTNCITSSLINHHLHHHVNNHQASPLNNLHLNNNKQHYHINIDPSSNEYEQIMNEIQMINPRQSQQQLTNSTGSQTDNNNHQHHHHHHHIVHHSNSPSHLNHPMNIDHNGNSQQDDHNNNNNGHSHSFNHHLQTNNQQNVNHANNDDLSNHMNHNTIITNSDGNDNNNNNDNNNINNTSTTSTTNNNNTSNNPTSWYKKAWLERSNTKSSSS